MTINSYRNYTNNVSAMKKNLEKLSSGYKINRAGDDAAGLAISEKMRAQITGLETAQKNAKDGISLVQTAEGALTEVHDMLNRMVELATQSANGTYDNTTDRAQMQKEINQLTDEINRIADSSNFNGIQLLDGSMDSTVKVGTDTLQGLNKFADYHSRSKFADATSKADVHKEATGASKTSFDFRFSDIKLTATGNETKFNFKLMSQNAKDAADNAATTGPEDFIAYNIGVTLDTTANEEIDASRLSDEVMKAIHAANSDDTIEIALDKNGTDTIEYKVSQNADGSLHFEMTEKGKNAAIAYYNDPNSNITTGGRDEKSLFGFHGNFDGHVAAADVNGKDKYNVSINGDTLDANGVTANQTGRELLDIANVKTGGPNTDRQLAETFVEFMHNAPAGDYDKIKDGAGMQIGNEYYIWAGSNKTFNAQYGDNVKVIDIRDLVDDSGKLKNTSVGWNGQNFGDLTEALNRLTEAAKDNEMFDVGTSRTGSMLDFREREDYNGDGKNGRADLTTEEGVTSQIKFFTSIDMKAAKSGDALTLQIGDTADSFNQLKVNIADMHASALGLDKISIANQTNAATAIDKIKAAINQVSDVRGTLGATQNRLDHTINNLSVMTENIQDAESTIRDTDVAEEMMAYTKNNILIQSAQAMLAQANQVPQGVLQLLQ